MGVFCSCSGIPYRVSYARAVHHIRSAQNRSNKKVVESIELGGGVASSRCGGFEGWCGDFVGRGGDFVRRGGGFIGVGRHGWCGGFVGRCGFISDLGSIIELIESIEHIEHFPYRSIKDHPVSMEIKKNKLCFPSDLGRTLPAILGCLDCHWRFPMDSILSRFQISAFSFLFWFVRSWRQGLEAAAVAAGKYFGHF